MRESHSSGSVRRALSNVPTESGRSYGCGHIHGSLRTCGWLDDGRPHILQKRWPPSTPWDLDGPFIILFEQDGGQWRTFSTTR